MADENLDLRFLRQQNDRLSKELAKAKGGDDLISARLADSEQLFAVSQGKPEVSPFIYWSRLAVLLSAQKDRSSIYVFESVFVGSALLFMYLIAFSPLSRPLNAVDGLIIITLVACTVVVAVHYITLARLSGQQLSEAVEATRAALAGDDID